MKVADVLHAGLAKGTPNLSAQQWKVLNNLLHCHTPALGGHVYRCDECGHNLTTWNSCRDRHCPSCQSVARAAWVEHRLNELLPVGYFHVVFTIPQELNPFALNNKAVFYNLMFRAVSECLSTLAKDPRWHGGTIGFIAVLHTWGQNLMDHPHLHCIVPGGGIRADGKKWKCFRDNYLFPVKVMSLLYRRLFLKHFKEYVDSGEIQFSGKLLPYTDSQKMTSLLNTLKKKQWVVYAKEPFATPDRVVKYVGSYTHRIAIANSRLVSLDDNSVSFRWKNYRQPGQTKTMTLHPTEFLRRFLMHVLPAGFVRIRYFGFLSNKDRHKNIGRCMQLLHKKYRPRTLTRSIAAILKTTAGKDITKCRICKIGHYHRDKEIQRAGYNTHTGPPYRKTTLRHRAGAWPSVVQHRFGAALGHKGPLGPSGKFPRIGCGVPTCPTPLRSVGTSADCSRELLQT